MFTKALIIGALAPLAALAADVGGALHVGFSAFAAYPTTASDAAAAGWKRSDPGCDPNQGIAYNMGGFSPSKAHPRTLFFTADGKFAGLGITVFGSVEKPLVTKGFWVPGPGSGAYTVHLATRAAGRAMCGGNGGNSEIIGDRIIVNPLQANFSIPMTEAGAQAGGWTQGACIAQMGTHWGFDLATSPKLSYEFGNLVPVVAMYHEGKINAVFTVSTDVQQSLLSSNGWDKVPLPELLFNLNFCGPDKEMWDDFIVSTGHIFFNAKPESVACPNGCSRCCL